MAYIKVDYSRLSSAANVVDSYVKLLRKHMRHAKGEVNDLFLNWSGADFSAFKKKWNDVSDNGSLHHEMVEALENYADYLQYAAKKYKSAQSKALNRANSLPRY